MSGFSFLGELFTQIQQKYCPETSLMTISKIFWCWSSPFRPWESVFRNFTGGFQKTWEDWSETESGVSEDEQEDEGEEGG